MAEMTRISLEVTGLEARINISRNTTAWVNINSTHGVEEGGDVHRPRKINLRMKEPIKMSCGTRREITVEK